MIKGSCWLPWPAANNHTEPGAEIPYSQINKIIENLEKGSIDKTQELTEKENTVNESKKVCHQVGILKCSHCELSLKTNIPNKICLDRPG